ncbi:MAG: aminotransferase class III-fold pyridoxal phosphate-dependent enzyme, partial [Bacillati bacterium ANGP1]
LIHISNLYQIPQQAELGRILVERTGVPEGQAFFCNSGTEAVEAAIKLARKAARTVRDRDAFEIIVADHGFHGRTMGALSATMVPRYHEDFGPLVPGFVEVPFNDLAAVERAITPKTAAVLMEPVRGEGGITPTTDAYLRGLRGLCDARGVWLVPLVRLPACGRGPRHRDPGQGDGGRGADWGDRGAWRDRGGLPAGDSRIDVRRQPPGLCGGARGDAGDRGGRTR